MSAGETRDKEAGVAKRRPGRPRKSETTSHDVAIAETLPEPVGAEEVMQAKREEEYPSLAAPNADEPGVDNTGQPEPQEGPVKIEATCREVHLGDERVIYGDGEGEDDERPKVAKVTKEVAKQLIDAGQAKRA